MKEIKEIVKAFDEAQKEGKRTALATVVHLEGSAYRRPGARMLVTEDGKMTGAISGGCLEGDALRKAQHAMVQQKPILVTYDTLDDDDSKLGVGLGCNGLISILIEPIEAGRFNIIEILRSFLGRRQKAVIVTLFSLERQARQHGTCLFLSENLQLESDSPIEGLAYLRSTAQEVLSLGISKTCALPGGLNAFLEVLKPPVSMWIFGAGNDSIPLVDIAHVLGWETTVIDGRSNYLSTERFKNAGKLVNAKPEQALVNVAPDDLTVALLMTHNYNYDLAILLRLMPLRLPYIGALGPKKKLLRMIGELQEDSLTPVEEFLESVYGPAGLDIGAETPQEIALSIISEINAVLTYRNGGFLRNQNEIHPRVRQAIG